MKICFVVQRYGLDIVGGAEYLTRLVAERLNQYHSIEVLTTCARDYRTWNNEYPEGSEEINGVIVRRFKTYKQRDTNQVNKIQDKIFYNAHSKNDEIQWIHENGPDSPDLIRFVKEMQEDYDCFVFFTFRYYPSYYGIKCVGRRSFLAPFAENEPALDLDTTKEIFQNAKGIIYSTPEERTLIRERTGIDDDEKFWDIVGCGIEIPDSCYDEKSDVPNGNYIIYVGRIEGSKGCYQLFEYYQRMVNDYPETPDLILVGADHIGIPSHKKIKYLGFVSEKEKFQYIKNSKFLIMPSPYESLSLVTLEAMACKTPVLVNGECEVLKGHCLRSNAGLYYNNYDEFVECTNYFLIHSDVRTKMGDNGSQYIQNNYSWEKICNSYLKLFNQI